MDQPETILNIENDKNKDKSNFENKTEYSNNIYKITEILCRYIKHNNIKLFFKTYYIYLLVLCIFIIAFTLLGTYSVYFKNLPIKGWISLIDVSILIIILSTNTFSCHLLFLFFSSILVILQCITPSDFLIGFSNTGVATIILLFVLSNGVSKTNALNLLFKYLLGYNKKYIWIYLIITYVSLGILSGFFNNTPIFTMSIPIILRWCDKMNINPSKIMMPLNNSLLLGGTLTLIGTSTNLIVYSFVLNDNALQSKFKNVNIEIFDISKIGFLYFITGMLYILIFSNFDFFLPERVSYEEQLYKNTHDYIVFLRVKNDAKYITDKKLKDIDITKTKGLFLIEIQRNDETIITPNQDIKLKENDILVFTGEIEKIINIYKQYSELVPINSDTHDFLNFSNKFSKSLYKVIISPNNTSLNRKKIKDINFKNKFNAGIVAISSNNGNLQKNKKIGEIKLKSGDTLIVEADSNFYKKFLNDSNFSILIPLKDSNKIKDDVFHVSISIFITIIMVIITSVGILDIFTSSLIACILIILTGCQTIEDAIHSINFPIILTIALSFGIGKSFENNDVGNSIGYFFINTFSIFGEIGILFSIYISVSLLTTFINNSAAVSIMYPVVSQILLNNQLNITPLSCIYTLMLGASSSFMSPIGYQTNLIAHSVAAYKFSDWIKFGVILQILLMLVSVFGCYYIYT